MLVSLEWLKNYIDINVDTDELCDKMIMSGSNIETCENIGNNITNVVVGQIKKIEKHPNADKLQICQIDVGKDASLQIVTGAKNVAEGDYVPVAIDGATIAGNKKSRENGEDFVTINTGELRGVKSEGMLCSFSELGYDDKVTPLVSRDGIWILDVSADSIGSQVTDVFDLKDSIIDFEITPNRSDCLSMIGMAREVAATFDSKVEYPTVELKEECGDDASNYIDVQIKSDKCKRYVAKIIKDVKIAPSPWWIQKRLIHAGMRPINNIVDITNYVMLEYGNPLHAFDIESVNGKKIIIDDAKGVESIVTLDASERKLDSQMLLINDAEKPIAIAGVMGGLNSEILDDTQVVVLESANFDADNVRRTSKQLALRTEASSRYEKGVDPNLCLVAADRVCQLIEETGAGKVVKGCVDVYPKIHLAPNTTIRTSRINQVLGTKLNDKDVTEILNKLEIEVRKDGESLIATPPTVRGDLLEEIDYVEEVARIYGYENIESTIPKGDCVSEQSEITTIIDTCRDALTYVGLTEIQTYSFVSPKSLSNISDDASAEDRQIKILNPLGEENSVMRTTLVSNMIDTLSFNYSKSIDKVKIFELGKTFNKDKVDSEGLPNEVNSLCIGSYGQDETFFGLKGVIVELMSYLGVDDLEFVSNANSGAFHPGRCADVYACFKGESIKIGVLGEIHPDVSEKFDIETKCYVSELNLDVIQSVRDKKVLFKKLPKYPEITRDIALIIDEIAPVGDIIKLIKSASVDILIKDNIQIFDIYKGENIEKGKKSVAIRLTYRHDERTLKDEEVVEAHQVILQKLENELNATECNHGKQKSVCKNIWRSLYFFD